MPKRAKTWTADQRRFQVWLATPEHDRVPFNQRMLAKEMGHDEGTLSDWKHIPGWTEEVNRLVDEVVKTRYPNIMSAFIREAEKGGFNHGKLLLEMLGKYTPRSEVKQEITGANGGPVKWVEVVQPQQVIQDGE